MNGDDTTTSNPVNQTTVPSTDGSNGSSGPQKYMDPSKVPPHVARLISDHKNGQGLVPMWVDPALSKDLQDYYGPSGHVIAHDVNQHGMLGHSMPSQDQSLPDLPSDQSMNGGSDDA